MLILILNVVLIVLLSIFYNEVKKQLQKSIMFDVSYLYFLKFTVFPLVFTFINILIFFFYSKEWFLLALMPLLIPVLRYIMVYFVFIKDRREYQSLEKTIKPLIIKEFEDRALFIDLSHISIRLLGNENKKRELDIVLSVKQGNRQIKGMEKVLQTELQSMIGDRYVVKVIIKLPYKKKDEKQICQAYLEKERIVPSL